MPRRNNKFTTLEKYRVHQIYIKEKYQQLWKDFINIIDMDERFNDAKKEDVGRHSTISLVILTLVNRYVKEMKTKLNITGGVDNETPNQNND